MTISGLLRFFLLSLLFVATCGRSQGLPKEVLRPLARAGVPSYAISVIVQALPTQSSSSATMALVAPKINHRPDVQLNPASVMKLITTYAALDQLGADFTWKNRVYIDGTVDQGVLNGHLILRGSGDPKLVRERIEDLFKQVQAHGVREVRGNILLDRSVFDVPDKNPADFDDEPLRPYNVAPDGLLLNFKSLILNFLPDVANKRVMVKSEPPMARVEIPLEVAASYGACGDWRSSLQADFSNLDRVGFAGRYPLACGERSWPVAYVAPRLYAPRVIEAMWLSSGGKLSGQVREEVLPRSAKLLVSADSLSLAEIIADVNKYSNNVMAQQVFLTLSNRLPSPGKQGSFYASQQQIAAWWKKTIPSAALPVVENGSGLSRKERATAAALTALLQHAAVSPQAAVFANSMGIAGVDGTVQRMRDRNPNSPAIGNAQLKTGTLRDVAAIAGYATATSGHRYSIVAIVNHANAPDARPALDALVEWVVNTR